MRPQGSGRVGQERQPVIFSDAAASAAPPLAPATRSHVRALPPWGPTVSCSKGDSALCASSVLDPRMEDRMENVLTPVALRPLGEPGEQTMHDTDSVASARAKTGPMCRGASTSLCQEHPQETPGGRG